jgi:hypothetical protein
VRQPAATPEGGTVLLTILQFTGSAIVGVFYVTILVAFATRKKSEPRPAHEEVSPRLGPAS